MRAGRAAILWAALLALPAALAPAAEDGQAPSALPRILSEFYSPEAAKAYSQGAARELTLALESGLADKEKLADDELAGRKELVLANHELFLAHTYLDKLRQPAKAAVYFKRYAERLAAARLTLDFLTEEYVRSQFPKQEGASRLIAAIGEARRWLDLRGAWALYVEAGLLCGDQEALGQGEALLRGLGQGGGVTERRVYRPEEPRREAGKVAITLKALHPNEGEAAADYALPFVPGARAFVLTVENRGTELVKFAADDFLLSANGVSVSALPEDKVPGRIVFSAPLEQFLYPELSPWTFSGMPHETYNQDVVEVNLKKAEAIREAKAEEKRAVRRVRIKKVLLTIASVYSVLGQAQMAMNAGAYSANASYAAGKASEARADGYLGAARHYQSQSSFYGALASQQQAALSHMQASNGQLFNYSGLTVANDAKVQKAWAKVKAIRPPDVFKYPPYVVTDREYAERVQGALAKLKRFTEADRFLPVKGSSVKKAKYAMTMGEMMKAFDEPKGKARDLKEELGSAVRVKGGKAWTGLLFFEADGLDADSASLSATLRIGEQEAKLSFALRGKDSFVITPKAVSYSLELAGEGASWGDTQLDYPLLWPALVPRMP